MKLVKSSLSMKNTKTKSVLRILNVVIILVSLRGALLGQQPDVDSIRCIKRAITAFSPMKWRYNKLPQFPLELDITIQTGAKLKLTPKLGLKLSYIVERESPNLANAFGMEFGIRMHQFTAPGAGKLVAISLFGAPYWRFIPAGKACHKRDFFVQFGSGLDCKVYAESKWLGGYNSSPGVMPYLSGGVGLFYMKRPDVFRPTDGPNSYVAVIGNLFLKPYFLIPSATNSLPCWFSIQYVWYIAKWQSGKYI